MPRTVGDVMSPNAQTLSPQATLEEAILFERKHRVRHIPVVQAGVLVGIVTDRDIKQATPSIVSGIDRDNYEVVLQTTMLEQIMTRDPVTATRATPLLEAVELFAQRRVGCLPVVEDGHLVGIITGTDLLRAFGDVLRGSGS